MEKGTWICVDSMEGEPRMTGKCGQYDHTDGMGQLQGSWGLAIQPSHDSFHIMSDEEIAAYKGGK